MDGQRIDEMNKLLPCFLQRGRRRSLAASLGCAALVLLAGCDNVEWGGVEVGIRQPVYEKPDSLEAVVIPSMETPATAVEFCKNSLRDNPDFFSFLVIRRSCSFIPGPDTTAGL